MGATFGAEGSAVGESGRTVAVAAGEVAVAVAVASTVGTRVAVGCVGRGAFTTAVDVGMAAVTAVGLEPAAGNGARVAMPRTTASNVAFGVGWVANPSSAA